MYVLCKNDFPVAVFSTEKAAKEMRQRYHRPNVGCFWHIHELELDPADVKEGAWQEQHLLGRYGRKVYDLIVLGHPAWKAELIARGDQ